jgi:hypothetical protein
MAHNLLESKAKLLQKKGILSSLFSFLSPSLVENLTNPADPITL